MFEVQGSDVFPVHRVDRHLAEIGDNEFLHQPSAGLDRARLAPDLDMLGQIALGELGDGGRRHRLRGIGVGVFTGLDASNDLGRLGAGLLRRDKAAIRSVRRNRDCGGEVGALRITPVAVWAVVGVATV